MYAKQTQSLNRTHTLGFRGSDIPEYIEKAARQLGAVYEPNHVEVLKNIDADDSKKTDSEQMRKF